LTVIIAISRVVLVANGNHITVREIVVTHGDLEAFADGEFFPYPVDEIGVLDRWPNHQISDIVVVDLNTYLAQLGPSRLAAAGGRCSA